MDRIVYAIIALFATFMVVLGYCSSLDYFHARKTKRQAPRSAGQGSAD